MKVNYTWTLERMERQKRQTTSVSKRLEDWKSLFGTMMGKLFFVYVIKDNRVCSSLWYVNVAEPIFDGQDVSNCIVKHSAISGCMATACE